MFHNFRLKFNKWIIAIIVLMVGLGLLAYANDLFLSKRCKKIVVNIKSETNQVFIEPKDIENLVTLQGTDPMLGKTFDRINLRLLEQRILVNKQIRSCQAYSDFQGNLKLAIETFVPIARISMVDGRPDQYLSTEGAFFPLSNYFTARVVVVSGEYFRGLSNLRNTKYGPVLAFLNQIEHDAFWKAQFAQINIEADGDISIVPLLGNHILTFGEPENIDNKLNKLKIFYKEILPVKGWDTFKQVNLTFSDQIVCK